MAGLFINITATIIIVVFILESSRYYSLPASNIDFVIGVEFSPHGQEIVSLPVLDKDISLTEF